ncbi:hypothetical protein J2T09_002160 [Neorhizobium huautlense]|uniref:Uncharacterized protein n=1 Tax=Neorhizobium huautlense TaxID=67774 RepID=A0ABT9PTH7_9HYPH|nr:hypothetical protein [Neorhizobium huautlense]MDP9837408.1 hypothetical protein [Neorhizobium huautlense]
MGSGIKQRYLSETAILWWRRISMGFTIHDAEVLALANEVKRMYGAKTMEQAIGMALAKVLKAPEKEPPSPMSFDRGEIAAEQRGTGVD